MTRKARPDGLPALLREAREHFTPPRRGASSDWSRIDKALEHRVNGPPGSTPVSALAARGRPPVVAVVSGVLLAAAAAATLFFRPAPPVREAPPTPVASVTTGEGLHILSATGQIRPRAGGAFVGDRIETTSRASLHSMTESPNKGVAWRLEAGAKVSVQHARMPLALALLAGSVDAEVDPVSSGEAFVVDVGPLRVAVRGTRLRVVRSGQKASVDLTEGTIVIGPVPLAGMTEGTRITAPAHVDLDLDHPADVRVIKAEVVTAPPEVSAKTPEKPPAPAPAAPPSTPRVDAGHVAAPAPLTPEDVALAVRGCIERSIVKGAVRVTVSTTLIVDADASGTPKIVRFDPPLAPDVQSCASEAVFKGRFGPSSSRRMTIVTEH